MSETRTGPNDLGDEQWLSILNGLGEAVIAADADGKVIFLNPVAEELTGWPLAQARGQDVATVYNVIEAATGAAIGRVLADVARSGHVVAVKVDMVLVRKAGDRVAILDTASPVKDAAERVIGVVVVFHDATTERQARDDLRRAVIEAYHRAKNNLQLLSALVEAQVDAEEEPLSSAAAHRLILHIRTLAQIQGLLTEHARAASGEGGKIDANELLAALVPMLRITVMPRLVEFMGEYVQLSPRAVTSLALVTNELITNALKHTVGPVIVNLRVVGGHASLDVRDEGVGFAASFDPATAANTGLELVENLVRHDLNGQTRYATLEEGGGLVRVTFPVPAS